MRTLTRRRPPLTLCALLCALALAGCGGSNNSVSGGLGPAPSPQPTTVGGQTPQLYISNFVGDQVLTLPLAGGQTANFGTYAGPTALNRPAGLAFDGSGNLYVANGGNDNLLKVDPTGATTVLLSNDNLLGARGLRFDQPSGTLFGAVETASLFCKVTNLTGTPTFSTFDPGAQPADIILDSQGNGFELTNRGGTAGALFEVPSLRSGGDSAVLFSTSNLGTPAGLAVDPAGNLWVANNGTNTIIRFPAAGGSFGANSTVFVAANGNGGVPLNGPNGICFDSAGNLYIANSGDNNILELPAGAVAGVTPTTLFVSSAGNGGVALRYPYYLAVH